MAKFTVKCVSLSDVGKSSACLTVGKEYIVRYVDQKEYGELFRFVDDNGNEQFGIYPACAFGEWEKVDVEG